MMIGSILLIVVGVLVVFGVGQRVLDKLRLTDRQALFFIGLIIIGGVIPDIPVGGNFYVNLGGCLIPLALAIYLWVRAGTWFERLRSAVAALVTFVAIYAIARFSPDEPENIIVDPNLLYGLAAGVIGYIFGRSRRGAFIAAVVGVILFDAASAIEVRMAGIDQAARFGGAGAMDVIVMSGLIAVLLSEIIGEIIERCVRGSDKTDREFTGGEIVREERRK